MVDEKMDRWHSLPSLYFLRYWVYYTLGLLIFLGSIFLCSVWEPGIRDVLSDSFPRSRTAKFFTEVNVKNAILTTAGNHDYFLRSFKVREQYLQMRKSYYEELITYIEEKLNSDPLGTNGTVITVANGSKAMVDMSGWIRRPPLIPEEFAWLDEHVNERRLSWMSSWWSRFGGVFFELWSVAVSGCIENLVFVFAFTYLVILQRSKMIPRYFVLADDVLKVERSSWQKIFCWIIGFCVITRAWVLLLLVFGEEKVDGDNNYDGSPHGVEKVVSQLLSIKQNPMVFGKLYVAPNAFLNAWTGGALVVLLVWPIIWRSYVKLWTVSENCVVDVNCDPNDENLLNESTSKPARCFDLTPLSQMCKFVQSKKFVLTLGVMMYIVKPMWTALFVYGYFDGVSHILRWRAPFEIILCVGVAWYLIATRRLHNKAPKILKESGSGFGFGDASCVLLFSGLCYCTSVHYMRKNTFRIFQSNPQRTIYVFIWYILMFVVEMLLFMTGRRALGGSVSSAMAMNFSVHAQQIGFGIVQVILTEPFSLEWLSLLILIPAMEIYRDLWLQPQMRVVMEWMKRAERWLFPDIEEHVYQGNILMAIPVIAMGKNTLFTNGYTVECSTRLVNRRRRSADDISSKNRKHRGRRFSADDMKGVTPSSSESDDRNFSDGQRNFVRNDNFRRVPFFEDERRMGSRECQRNAENTIVKVSAKEGVDSIYEGDKISTATKNNLHDGSHGRCPSSSSRYEVTVSVAEDYENDFDNTDHPGVETFDNKSPSSHSNTEDTVEQSTKVSVHQVDGSHAMSSRDVPRWHHPRECCIGYDKTSISFPIAECEYFHDDVTDCSQMEVCDSALLVYNIQHYIGKVAICVIFLVGVMFEIVLCDVLWPLESAAAELGFVGGFLSKFGIQHHAFSSHRNPYYGHSLNEAYSMNDDTLPYVHVANNYVRESSFYLEGVLIRNYARADVLFAFAFFCVVQFGAAGMCIFRNRQNCVSKLARIREERLHLSVLQNSHKVPSVCKAGGKRWKEELVTCRDEDVTCLEKEVDLTRSTAAEKEVSPEKEVDLGESSCESEGESECSFNLLQGEFVKGHLVKGSISSSTTSTGSESSSSSSSSNYPTSENNTTSSSDEEVTVKVVNVGERVVSVQNSGRQETNSFFENVTKHSVDGPIIVKQKRSPRRSGRSYHRNGGRQIRSLWQATPGGSSDPQEVDEVDPDKKTRRVSWGANLSTRLHYNTEKKPPVASGSSDMEKALNKSSPFGNLLYPITEESNLEVMSCSKNIYELEECHVKKYMCFMILCLMDVAVQCIVCELGGK